MMSEEVEHESTVLIETVEKLKDKEDKEYTVSFKMTSKGHEKLENYAKEHGLSKSTVIRNAVNKFVDQKEGLIEAKIPLADYKTLMLLIDKDQIYSLEEGVREAIRLLNLKKAEEFKETRDLRANLS